MNPEIEKLRSDIKFHEAQIKNINTKIADLKRLELKEKSLAERIVYAAYARCPCGAGLAYDPLFEDENSVFRGPLSGFWDCSKILLGTADPNAQHTDKLPFAFYEVLEEGQPSARGATTRGE